jgi:hypothetical protein
LRDVCDNRRRPGEGRPNHASAVLDLELAIPLILLLKAIAA